MIPERSREYRKREGRKVQRDKKLAEVRAKELRAEGLSLRAIGERLLKEGLYPPGGAVVCGDGGGVVERKGCEDGGDSGNRVTSGGMQPARTG